MTFNRGQKQILNFVPTSKGFLMHFLCARLAILDQDTAVQHKIAGQLIVGAVQPLRKFIENIRNSFSIFSRIRKSQNFRLTKEEINVEYHEYLNFLMHFLNSDEAVKKSLKPPAFFSEEIRSMELIEPLTEVRNFLVYDTILEDFDLTQFAFFDPKDDTPEFWDNLINYYARSLCFDCDPEQVLDSLFYALQERRLKALLKSGKYSDEPLSTYFEGMVSITRQAFIGGELPENYDVRMFSTRMEWFERKMNERLAIFQLDLSRRQPRFISTKQKNSLLVLLILLFFILYVTNTLNIWFSLGFSAISMLIAHFSINRLNQKKQAVFQAYIANEYDRIYQLYLDCGKTRRVHIVNTNDRHEAKEPTIEVCIFPQQMRNTSLLAALTPQTVTEIPDDDEDEKEDRRGEEKRVKLKRRHQPSLVVPTTRQKPAEIELQSSPDEITFENGMTYRKDDKKGTIKKIDDGTATLFGILDVETVSRDAKSAEENRFFAQELERGVYVPRNKRGKCGVKQLGHDSKDLFYDPRTKTYSPYTTKLRPAGTPARVKGHRFFATEVIVNGRPLDKPDRYRLDVYDTYVPGKKSHR